MRTIPLVNGSGALVDDADFDWLSQWQWRAHKLKTITVAVRYQTNGPIVYMHRAVLAMLSGGRVCHLDGDGLNNQRANLRLATQSEVKGHAGLYKNNTSGFKGVWWNKRQQKWQAGIRVHRKLYHLGFFERAEDAAAAYWNAAQRYFGEFARAA